jgi:hypothetical protein
MAKMFKTSLPKGAVLWKGKFLKYQYISNRREYYIESYYKLVLLNPLAHTSGAALQREFRPLYAILEPMGIKCLVDKYPRQRSSDLVVGTCLVTSNNPWLDEIDPTVIAFYNEHKKMSNEIFEQIIGLSDDQEDINLALTFVSSIQTLPILEPELGEGWDVL